jgi:hypothetical protein
MQGEWVGAKSLRPSYPYGFSASTKAAEKYSRQGALADHHAQRHQNSFMPPYIQDGFRLAKTIAGTKRKKLKL